MMHSSIHLMDDTFTTMKMMNKIKYSFCSSNNNKLKNYRIFSKMQNPRLGSQLHMCFVYFMKSNCNGISCQFESQDKCITYCNQVSTMEVNKHHSSQAFVLGSCDVLNLGFLQTHTFSLSFIVVLTSLRH